MSSANHGVPQSFMCRRLQVIDAVNALAYGAKDNTATAQVGAVMVNSGQVRRGKHVPILDRA